MVDSKAGKSPATPSKHEKPATKSVAGKASSVCADQSAMQRAIAYERILAVLRGDVPHGLERNLVRTFIESHNAGHFDERIPQQSSSDTVVEEYSLRHGRADVVMFHLDGTATVIEVKDGEKGYSHVVAGIGQCSLYAAQIAAKPGVVKAIQRCLLWSSVGDLNADAAIEDACEMAGVTALPYPSMGVLMATRVAARIVVERITAAGGEHGRP